VYDRFVRVLFAEDIADISDVTREEINTAVDTTEAYCLTGIDGWEADSAIITDPNWGVFLAQRPGQVSVRAAVLQYAALPSGMDVRALLARGVRGYIMILPAGDEPGTVMNVYPVWVAKVFQLQRLGGPSGGGGALVQVNCAIRRTVAENVIVPGF
jgi:hypothetical protein